MLSMQLEPGIHLYHTNSLAWHGPPNKERIFWLWSDPPSAGRLQNQGSHVVKREPRGQWDAIRPNISPVVGRDTTHGTYRCANPNG
jgi:hypothetical protein